jgi:PAS domain S-box-containing protein
MDDYEQLKLALKQAEAQVKRLEGIIALLPGHVYWEDLSGKILGCNDLQMIDAGFSSRNELIGRNVYDVVNKDHIASLRKSNTEVMKTGKTLLFEEISTIANGKKVVWLSRKTPLRDSDGNIEGVLGISVDITEMKEAETREKQAREEAAHANARAEEQEKFAKVADQVAHDIRSPLASLLMIIKSCHEIPETERVALREAAISIGDIANSLLAKYKAKEAESSIKTEERQPTLLSATLLQILTDKKFQYNELPVKFQHDFHTAGQFSFSQLELSSFKRMMSNLINNAVDAFEKKEGQVTLELDATDEHVYIKVIDNGKGMPPELIEKIMQKIAVTEGKAEGHGIGLTQVRETLERNNGKLSIHSTVGQGTQIILEFPRIKAPNWIADKIILNPQDIVVILDDDASIHFAWDARFEEIIEKAPKIRVKHFEVCQEAIDFIKKLDEADYKNVFLLTDFELLKQELNGLHVVEKTKIERSILVTSHYTNMVVYERAIKIGTKILPKQLASEIPIYIDHTTNEEKQEPQKEGQKKVDLVLVDDNETFAQTLIDFIFDQDVVDYYRDPRKLLANLNQYPKDTRIYLDNNFTMVDELGIDFAKNLHELGFTRLYLLSGDTFKPGEIPSYLTVIIKTDIDKIRDW